MTIGADLDGVSDLARRNRTVDTSFSSEVRKSRHGRLRYGSENEVSFGDCADMIDEYILGLKRCE